jgi:hypothetical protein
LRLVSAQIVEVTPAIAQEWLKGNCKNRPLNEAKVAFFAEKMRCGQWQLKGGFPVKRLENGRLLNGQHRLNAVIRAGCPVQLKVTVYKRD